MIWQLEYAAGGPVVLVFRTLGMDLAWWFGYEELGLNIGCYISIDNHEEYAHAVCPLNWIVS